jgi:hypothetical protein
VVKKLALDSMNADFFALQALLGDRTPETDPIGFMQLSRRHELLHQKILALDNQLELKASVALFFAGGPVVGSRGIKVDFVGPAIEIFQDLVAKQFAAEEIGDIGTRGPVPLRASSDLLLTDLARGSVGVILEEADQNDVITETQLKIVVDHVADAIFASSEPTIDRFEQLLETIDHRYLASLGNLFKLLDDENATARIVEGERDVQLDGIAIKRGRDRTGSAQIEESETDEFVGRVFFLPGHRRFELDQLDGRGMIYGAISTQFARERLQALIDDGNVLGHIWRVRMKVRSVFRANREPKLSYVLIGLSEQLDP